MNVLSVIHYPHFGGPHNRNSQIAAHLAEMGVNLTVVVPDVPDEPGNAATLLRARNVSVVAMPLGRLRSSLDPTLHVKTARSFRRNVRELRTLIRRLEIDVVLINGLHNPHAALAARLEEIPIVWQLLDTFGSPSARRLIMPFVSRTAAVVMTSGIAVARVHPGAMDFGDRLISFFPGVDMDRFKPDPERRASAREELGFEADDVVIGNINNINPMKGHGTFIKAAAELKKQRPEVRFVLLGSTSVSHAAYKEHLLEEAGQLGLSVGSDFRIYDPQNRVPDLAPALDVFWLTSEPRSEGLSTAIGEAMALEIPVVAADVGAVNESVADGITGVLVPSQDPETLAATTDDLLRDSAKRRQFGQNGRKRAQELYSSQRTADLHKRAFELALESS